MHGAGISTRTKLRRPGGEGQEHDGQARRSARFSPAPRAAALAHGRGDERAGRRTCQIVDEAELWNGAARVEDVCAASSRAPTVQSRTTPSQDPETTKSERRAEPTADTQRGIGPGTSRRFSGPPRPSRGPF